MKMFLVFFLLLTLGLNSFADPNLKGRQEIALGDKQIEPNINPYLPGYGSNPYTIGYGSKGLLSTANLPKVCEIQDEDSNGFFTRTFSYRSATADSKMEYLSIVTTRVVLDKKKQPTGKISWSVLTPPQKDIKKLKFSGKFNPDKSSLLESNLKLCIAQNKSKSFQQLSQTQAAYINQVPQLVDQAAVVGFQIGFMKGLSHDAYSALLLGEEIGKLKGLELYVPPAYQMGFEDGEKVGESNGIIKGVVGTVEALNNVLQSQGPNSERVYGQRPAPVTAFSNKGAYTRVMADQQKRNAGKEVTRVGNSDRE